VDDGRVEGEGRAVQVQEALCEVLGGPSLYNRGGTLVGKESAEGAESCFQRQSTTKARDEQNPALIKDPGSERDDASALITAKLDIYSCLTMSLPNELRQQWCIAKKKLAISKGTLCIRS
jgi:hypothetical protein